MRAFFLVDPANPDDEYSLTMSTHFLYSPQGLGFEEDNTYRQIGGNFILANTKPKQSVIQGNIHFGGSTPYSRYRDFLAYCARPNIQLAYYTGESAARDKQRNVYKIHAGTGFTETVDGQDTYYPGVLEVNPNVLGSPANYYYANAVYELQRRIVRATHIICRLQTTFYNTAPYKTIRKSGGESAVEAYIYRFSDHMIKNNTPVYCNLLPYFGNVFDPTTFDDNSYFIVDDDHADNRKYYTNQVYQKGEDSYIYFCIRADTIANQETGLAGWVADASINGLQFYGEKA